MEQAEPKEKRKKVLLLILLIVAIFVLLFWLYGSNKNFSEANVTIRLNGSYTTEIIYGNSYNDLGGQVFVGDDSVLGLKIDTSKVNINKLGKYEVVYTYNYNGIDYVEKRIVNVVDKKAPELVLNGNSDLKIFQNSTYVEAGYEVIDDYDEDLNDKVIVTGNVNSEKLGIYNLTYIVCDSSNNCSTKIRMVEVISKYEFVNDRPAAPVEENYVTLSLKGPNEVYLEWPDEYNELGFSVDSSDGNISNLVKVTGQVGNDLGTYTLTYQVTNSKGKTVSASRTVVVRDTTKPVFTLTGSSSMELVLGNTFNEPGIKAIDNYDGDITTNITVTSNLNENVVGTYYIRYQVKDSSRNMNEVIRYVIVRDTVKPTISIDSSKMTVNLEKGTSYNLVDGVTASDNLDGNITNKVTFVSNPSLNLNKVGTYVITYSVKDSSDNEAVSVTKTVNVVDTVLPSGQISYSNTDPTGGSVTVTLTTDEEIVVPSGWLKINNTTYVKTYNVNVNETITITDLSANVSTVLIDINNIDKVAPVGNVTYDLTSLTNNNVEATIITNELIQIPNGWMKVSDTKYTKIYEKNTTENIIIVDGAGNSSNVIILISNIDKKAPIITVLNDNPFVVQHNSTYADAGATAIDNIDGDLTSLIDSVSDVNTSIIGLYNVTYSVTDEAGNEVVAKRTVIVNDTLPPTVSLSYSPNTQTNDRVVVKLTASKAIQTPLGWTKVSDTEYTKVYTENISGQLLTIKDLSDNIGIVTINVSNIDKVAPIITLIGADPYNIPLNKTYIDPGVTVFDDIDGNIEEVTVTSDVNVNVEGTYVVTYKSIDSAGNEAILIRNVEVIDYSPHVNIVYNPVMNITASSVTATLMADREITTPDGWINEGDNITFTKIYTENVMDEVVTFASLIGGYAGSSKVNITNIDKTKPAGIITYNPDSTTNSSVLVTLVTDEKIIIPNGWTNIDDRTYTKIYLTNVDTSINIVDVAGNTNEVPILINWIDAEIPTGTITYSKTTSTNQNVIATLKASKPIQTPVSWIKVDDLTYTKEYSFNTLEMENISLIDTLGNSNSVSVYITWIDKEAPEVTLLGDSVYHLEQYKSYIEPGVIAIDNVDGEITNKINISGNVDSDTIGSYTLNYEVEDVAGNVAAITRTVIVEDVISPTGVLSYSTNLATKENVIVTLKTSEEITTISGWTKVNATTYTKIYPNNITGEIVNFVDLAGNGGMVSVNITWIDKAYPSGSVTLSPFTFTNGSVLVTLTANEKIKTPSGWTKIDDLTYTKVYTENLNTIINIEDLVGNISNVTIDIINIDKVVPMGTIFYSPNSTTSDKVTVTLTTNKEIVLPAGWTKINSLEYTKDYFVNTTENLEIKDALGNTNQLVVLIDWINNDNPVATLSYSTTNKVNGNVKVTMTTNKEILTPANWTKIDATTYTKEYEENIKETIIIEDSLHRTNEITVSIDNIDKTAPTANLIYSTNVVTSGSVAVTLTTNEQVVIPVGWTKISEFIYVKVYDENYHGNLTIEDLAGNINEVTIDITNIDQMVPIGEIVYSPGVLTNAFVEVTLTTNEEIEIPTGWTKISSTKFTKTYYTKVTEDIVITDLAGNIGNLLVTINNIDKTAPTGVISYSPSISTNDDVIVTLTTNEVIEMPVGWSKVNDTTYIRIYSTNNSGFLSITDLAGNNSNVSVTINWIDKTAPIGNITYSPKIFTKNNVIATLSTNENVITPTGWTKINNTTYTKIFTGNIANQEVVFIDTAGNTGSSSYTIDWIDKTSPIITSIGNPKENVWTNQDIVLNPVIDETGSGFQKFLWNMNGGEWREDFNNTFTEEMVATIGLIAVDNVGNQSPAVYTNIKIDKTVPKIILNGSSSMTLALNELFVDPFARVVDNFSSDLSIVMTGEVDVTREATYFITYTVTDLAGNEATPVRRTVYVTSSLNLQTYAEEMAAIEALILDINENSETKIGTALNENTGVNIRGINYYDRWYRIAAQDLTDAGYQNSNSFAPNYLDMTHAPYIVRYEYTPGAVLSIAGEVINSVPIHTFNYNGDPESYSLYTNGLLSGVTSDSTKDATTWGEMRIGTGTGAGALNPVGGGTYDAAGGLVLGDKVAMLTIDQSRPVNEQYSVVLSVKGPFPQTNTSDGFPRTILAISSTSGQYLSWIGINNKYLHVYSFYSGGAKSGINQEQYSASDPGFISFSLENLKLDCTTSQINAGICDENNQRIVNVNNEILNIQVTAQRRGETKIYINGVLYKTIVSGSALLDYGTATIGDLRGGRNLKYNGAIYNFVLYSEIIDQNAVTQNWDYFKNNLGIE